MEARASDYQELIRLTAEREQAEAELNARMEEWMAASGS